MKAAIDSVGSQRNICSQEDLSRLRALLKANARDLLFFELAVHTGLHAKDLLNLTVADLEGLKTGQELKLGRIPKPANRIVLSSTIRQIYTDYVSQASLSSDDFLFRSQKGGRPLTLVSLSRILRKWFTSAGLSVSGSLLVLRRTWAYLYRIETAEGASKHFTKRKKRLHSRQSASLRDTVFKELQRGIVSGRIIPGNRIFIESISRSMGVSAIPVREAIAMLAAGGFVHSEGKRGYLVNELCEDNLKEILKLRLLLECLAAEQASLRATRETVNLLEEIHRRYIIARKANDYETLLSTNKEFHHTIYREAEMPILKSHIDKIWDQVSPYYHIMFRQAEKPNPVVGIQYHERLIHAIRSRNPREARRWIKADLTDSTRFVIELFNIHKKQIESP